MYLFIFLCRWSFFHAAMKIFRLVQRRRLIQPRISLIKTNKKVLQKKTREKNNDRSNDAGNRKTSNCESHKKIKYSLRNYIPSHS